MQYKQNQNLKRPIGSSDEDSEDSVASQLLALKEDIGKLLERLNMKEPLTDMPLAPPRKFFDPLAGP